MMEIKVGIIENEDICATHLVNLLKQWSSLRQCEVLYNVYLSGEDILSKPEIDYNILFIDIQLSNINGVETAKQIRKNKYTGAIVFITAYNEYVFEGYEVRALNYILKPITVDKLFSCMDTILKSVQSENYILRNRDIVEIIPYNQIIYILSAKHHMELVTLNITYRHWISIKNIMKILPIQFIQCHRTVIINISHIKRLQGHSAIMSNDVCLPISNTFIENVRDQFEKSIF